ncbi:RNase adapter RapZ [Desulfuromonas sp. TF]|jgi:UPF0042 nucleotide-binding protein|uniref:RNase adapter RapZ n=1 Tax=Desulfuromonas sp. TF TaxID=1232410 RepID=UPI0003F8B1D9|nr:RNase adapter RapZ [Desulfuromonas sp. TF]
MSRKRVFVLTGLSGSGKTAAAHALEDEGFFVVDNLPMALFPQFLEMADQGGKLTADVAVVIDVRNREFLAGFEKNLQNLKALGYQPVIYFFDASDETLIRRYSETRRRHPLAGTDGVPAAIRRERQLLEELKRSATAVIDSSGLTPHQLRSRVVQIVKGEEGSEPLVVRLQSFGYRYGVPLESDLVMDVRFLPNPHFVEELRPLGGLDMAVSTFVLSQPACQEFLRYFKDLMMFLLPQYRKEGKSYLTISVGCTGGHHRSVAVVEALRPAFVGEGITLEVNHRDLAKG